MRDILYNNVIYRVLFCEACYDVTDVGVKSLTFCEQLNYLNISYCHHVSILYMSYLHSIGRSNVAIVGVRRSLP